MCSIGGGQRIQPAQIRHSCAIAGHAGDRDRTSLPLQILVPAPVAYSTCGHSGAYERDEGTFSVEFEPEDRGFGDADV
jgi:hypothetical protein